MAELQPGDGILVVGVLQAEHALCLRGGEILVLLGPNGAGKSTLVKAMSGRLKLDGGSIWVGGLDPSTNAEASPVGGIEPQQIALFEKLTAAENLETFGRLMGVTTPDIAKLAALTLDKVGLATRAKDRGTVHSGRCETVRREPPERN